MSYPGRGHNTYNQSPGSYQNYGPPTGPPPGPPPSFGGGGYGPPPGPPPGRPGSDNYRSYGSSGYSNSYAPPSGPPSGQSGPPLGPPPGRPGSYGVSYSQGSGSYGNSPNVYGAEGYGGSRGRPPTGMQSFGGGADGYKYQYSDCSGKRKALLIGINYIGTSNALKGCINDARAMARFLQQKWGYKEDDMVILTDDSSNPRSQPTRANILAAMHWLVSGARTNDSLVLHYSGHGGTTKDLDGDEEDGYDEVIYPVDFQTAGHIVDDEIHEITVKPLMPGVRLTGIFDSCHSGTVMDLPYVYSTKGVVKEPNLGKEAGMGLLTAVSSYSRGDIGGIISAGTKLFTQATRGSSARQKQLRTKTSPADVIQFSGCKDDQTSADSQNAGTATGAMSYAFLTVMSQNSNQTYISLLNNLRNVMVGKYSQKPQLSSSHPIDVNLQFIM